MIHVLVVTALVSKAALSFVCLQLGGLFGPGRAAAGGLHMLHPAAASAGSVCYQT